MKIAVFNPKTKLPQKNFPATQKIDIKKMKQQKRKQFLRDKTYINEKQIFMIKNNKRTNKGTTQETRTHQAHIQQQE